MSLPPQPGSHLLDQNSSLQSLQDVNSFKPESDDGFSSRPSLTKITAGSAMSKPHPFDVMRISCIVLHLALIVFLLYLVALPFPASQKLGDGLVFFRKFAIPDADSLDIQHPLRSIAADLLVSYQKTVFGGLINIYCVLLSLTTQKLSLRRLLHLENTLTTKHDTVNAWSGLGSAFMTIFGWRRDDWTTESLSTVWIAAVYLATIFVFQSIAGGMAVFQALPMSSSTSIQTQGIPDFTQGLGNMVTGSSSLLTIRSLENFINFTGLANNGLGAIYNIPVDREQLSTFDASALTVSASYFNVECGEVSGKVDSEKSVFLYDFIGNGDFSTLPDLSKNMITLNTAPWGIMANNSNSDMALWPPTLLVLSTVPILDSSNGIANTVPVDPVIEYQSLDNDSQVVNEVFALACNLTLESLNVTINPRTFGLLESNALSAKNKSESTLGQFPIATRSVMNTNTSDTLVQTWPFLTEIAVSPLNEFFNEQAGARGLRLSETDQFVMESFDVFPDRIMSTDQARTSSSQIYLHDLENTLSRMTAISIWSQAWGTNQKFASQADRELGDITGKIDTVYETASVDVVKFYWFLTLNLRELYGAFALSIFLLALATPAILDINNKTVDSIGVLQIVWLLKDHSKLVREIGEVENPITDKLRGAGRGMKVHFEPRSQPSV
ncbi:hypothetical protein VKT23_001683 [Stygiomarasmius scandens]|uniref:Uncharacterized protein n=1 Tax=Marasmiellus scandens TaxID=2682957 RepID=A0ABR1K064_9AGAR